MRYINDKSVYKKITRSEAVSQGNSLPAKPSGSTLTKEIWSTPTTDPGLWHGVQHSQDGWLICFHTSTGSTETFGVGCRNSGLDGAQLVQGGEGSDGERCCTRIFEAPISREVAVELPVEDGAEPGSEMVGLLQKSLYGTRDAAANFQREVKKFMREQGFVVGAYNVSTFYHRQRGLCVMVHGDDFISTGSRNLCPG